MSIWCSGDSSDFEGDGLDLWAGGDCSGDLEGDILLTGGDFEEGDVFFSGLERAIFSGDFDGDRFLAGLVVASNSGIVSLLAVTKVPSPDIDLVLIILSDLGVIDEADTDFLGDLTEAFSVSLAGEVTANSGSANVDSLTFDAS